MTVFKTSVLALWLALSGTPAAFSQGAAQYPAKPIRIVVPYPAGGGIDVLSRVIGERLSHSLGQPVLVDNRPGAGTLLAAEFVARAPADGYTFMVTTDSTLTINPHLYAKLPYDPVKDFTPITQLVLPNQSGRQSVVTFVANGDRWTYQPSCDAQGGH